MFNAPDLVVLLSHTVISISAATPPPRDPCLPAKVFMIFQFLAVVAISAAMVAITLSFFSSHARVSELAHIGVRLLMGYAMSQLVAVIMVGIIKERERESYCRDPCEMGDDKCRYSPPPLRWVWRRTAMMPSICTARCVR